VRTETAGRPASNVAGLRRCRRRRPGLAVALVLAALAAAQLASAATASAAPCVDFVIPELGSTLGGTDVRISGNELADATSVRFGDVEVAGFTVQDPFTVLAVSPPHAAGTVDVTVTTPAGTSTPCDPAIPTSDDFRFVDEPAGTWSRDGLMASARQDHTATRLLDGRVLVAGGDVPDAELYDPVARVWRPTGALNTARAGATATLLRDGRVLLAGGTGQIGTDPASGNPITGPLDTAELYDPASGTWSLTTNTMSTPRSQHTATALANGKVLVVGGIGVANVLLGATDLFDPATSTWSSCSPPATPSADCPGPLNVARRVHTAMALRNGRVLVAAGKGANPPSPIQVSLTSTELYDPATGTWSTCSDATASATCPGPLAIARFGPTSVTLDNGRALVIAGQAFDGTRIASVEEYDPTTGHWGPTGFLGARRTTHQATLLADGKVLVAGGFGPDAQGTLVPEGEVYDPATRRWTFTTPMIVPRQLPTMTLLADGQVLVTGGRDGNLNPIRQSELFTPTPPPVPPVVAPAPPAPPAAPAPPAPEGLRSLAGCPASTTNTISPAPAIHAITATAGADRIFAGDGDDLVNALAGDDCVDLGAGADRGSGDAGDDLLLGDAGNDRLSGGNGDDRMTGDAGSDSLSGGRGDDVLQGGPGADGLSGGRGDDRLGGGSGNDRIAGGPGRDVITGSAGNDRILARDGNRDRIDCGSGRDSVRADASDSVARNCERVRRR